jgi:methylenetetrahydrofolate dehydrogenase (NADP+)/methenyltetrahydrofolate cyclohydrolase
MPLIMDGRIASRSIREKIKEAISNIQPPPTLAIITEDSIYNPYINVIEKGCKEVGIICKKFFISKDAEENALINSIDELNKDKDISGIIINFNLLNYINLNSIKRAILPSKDVGCISPLNIGRFISGNPLVYPPVPFGIIKLLDYYGIDVKGMNTVVVGRSNRIGKPIGICLLNKNATVTICHTKTYHIYDKTRDAQLLISATGQENMIKDNMIRDGVIIVDVGMNKLEDGRIVGDVDYESVISKVSAITPVPGGVGPMNITIILYNTLISAGINIDL